MTGATMSMGQSRNVAAFIALVLGGTWFVDSSAAGILEAQYSAFISPSERTLAAIGTPEYDKVLMDESCDNPHIRVRARNKPKFRIDNKNASDAPIEEFTILINDGPYLFGDGDDTGAPFDGFIRHSIFFQDPGVSIIDSFLSPSGTELTVKFDGLDPGKSVIFAVDLDAADMDLFPYPDYRNVLFGAPLNSLDTPNLPATISARFVDGDMERTLTSDLPQSTEVPDWSGNNLRPYHVMDMIEVEEITPIPEPSTWTLAALALGALAAVSRRTAR